MPIWKKRKTVSNLVAALKSIKIQYQNSEENTDFFSKILKTKIVFDKSEEKYKEGLMDAYTFFVVRNNWLQANYNLIKSRYDVKCYRKNSGKYIIDRSSVISIPLEEKKYKLTPIKLSKITYEIKLFLIAVCSPVLLFSQKIFTQDVDNFWKTYDKIIKTKDSKSTKN